MRRNERPWLFPPTTISAGIHWVSIRTSIGYPGLRFSGTTVSLRHVAPPSSVPNIRGRIREHGTLMQSRRKQHESLHRGKACTAMRLVLTSCHGAWTSFQNGQRPRTAATCSWPLAPPAWSSRLWHRTREICGIPLAYRLFSAAQTSRLQLSVTPSSGGGGVLGVLEIPRTYYCKDGRANLSPVPLPIWTGG